MPPFGPRGNSRGEPLRTASPPPPEVGAADVTHRGLVGRDNRPSLFLEGTMKILAASRRLSTGTRQPLSFGRADRGRPMGGRRRRPLRALRGLARRRLAGALLLHLDARAGGDDAGGAGLLARGVVRVQGALRGGLVDQPDELAVLALDRGVIAAVERRLQATEVRLDRRAVAQVL